MSIIEEEEEEDNEREVPQSLRAANAALSPFGLAFEFRN